jgi:hypothetical protein
MSVEGKKGPLVDRANPASVSALPTHCGCALALVSAQCRACAAAALHRFIWSPRKRRLWTSAGSGGRGLPRREVSAQTSHCRVWSVPRSAGRVDGLHRKKCAHGKGRAYVPSGDLARPAWRTRAPRTAPRTSRPPHRCLSGSGHIGARLCELSGHGCAGGAALAGGCEHQERGSLGSPCCRAKMRRHVRLRRRGRPHPCAGALDKSRSSSHQSGPRSQALFMYLGRARSEVDSWRYHIRAEFRPGVL